MSALHETAFGGREGAGGARPGEATGAPLPLRGSRYRWHGSPAEAATTSRAGGGASARGAVGAEALPFRRRAVRPRRRRQSLGVRLLGPLATAALLVGAPAALAGWVLTTSRFALEDIAIAGTERVPEQWVAQAVEPFRDEHLLTLRLARVERAIAGHPWIAAVSIAKRLPDGLTIEIVERRPAALVPDPDGDPGGPWLADAGGRPIVQATPQEAEGLIVVVPSSWDGAGEGSRRIAAVPAALELAREIARDEPVWAAGLERLESLGDGDFRIWTAALPFPVVVERGRLEPAAERLRAVLPELADRRPQLTRIAEADLRFEGRLVLRPAADDAGREDGEPTAAAGSSDVEAVAEVGGDEADERGGAGATAASEPGGLESRATDRREVG